MYPTLPSRASGTQDVWLRIIVSWLYWKMIMLGTGISIGAPK